jgi:hypothetical protein
VKQELILSCDFDTLARIIRFLPQLIVLEKLLDLTLEGCQANPDEEEQFLTQLIETCGAMRSLVEFNLPFLNFEYYWHPGSHYKTPRLPETVKFIQYKYKYGSRSSMPRL